MAKTPSKKASASPKKATREKSVPASDAEESIVKACEQTLEKMKSLGIDAQLQGDLEWCLGSYRYDKNPEGLYEMAVRAIVVLQGEKAKKTKGVTVKWISDLEKAVSKKPS